MSRAKLFKQFLGRNNSNDICSKTHTEKTETEIEKKFYTLKCCSFGYSSKELVCKCIAFFRVYLITIIKALVKSNWFQNWKSPRFFYLLSQTNVARSFNSFQINFRRTRIMRYQHIRLLFKHVFSSWITHLIQTITTFTY